MYLPRATSPTSTSPTDVPGSFKHLLRNHRIVVRPSFGFHPPSRLFLIIALEPNRSRRSNLDGVLTITSDFPSHLFRRIFAILFLIHNSVCFEHTPYNGSQSSTANRFPTAFPPHPPPHSLPPPSVHLPPQIFGASYCPYHKQAKALFTDNGLPCHALDLGRGSTPRNFSQFQF